MLDKRFADKEYTNLNSVVNDVCLLFDDEKALEDFGNEDYVKETFLGEDVFAKFTVTNNFNVK